MTKYVLRHDQLFLVGTCSFELEAGAVVYARQYDELNRKVLVDFGSGIVDWISMDTLFHYFDIIVST